VLSAPPDEALTVPKLKPATQIARRAHILDVAERCFAGAGFHRTTMLDICLAANVSAGALYGYFASKEELIAGICERDRAKLATELADLAEAPDLIHALGRLAEHYAVEEPLHKRILCIEMGLESTRNPAIATIFRSVDQFVIDSFEKLFDRARDEGRIAPSLDSATLARVVATMGDGMFWRRAVDPDHDAERMIGVLLAIITSLLNPVQPLAMPQRPRPPVKATT
jgi:TetR/AcrR family transcriptional regulator, repressor for uid operon